MLHTCIHVRSHLWSLWLVSPTLPLFSPPLHTMLGELQPCLFPQPTADGLYWLQWSNGRQALSKHPILSAALSFNSYSFHFQCSSYLTSSILHLTFAQNHLLLHAGACIGKGRGLYSTEEGQTFTRIVKTSEH